jgi:hypothetical protein
MKNTIHASFITIVPSVIKKKTPNNCSNFLKIGLLLFCRHFADLLKAELDEKSTSARLVNRPGVNS